MGKPLQKTGNGYALVIDRPLMEATRIKPDTPLEVTGDGEVIVIAPIRDEARQSKFKTAKQKVVKQYQPQAAGLNVIVHGMTENGPRSIRFETVRCRMAKSALLC
jgi:antitoxin component of MazEF toxin-antitoxin module